MKIVCVKIANLRKLGYKNLEHWLEDPTHCYQGRDMTFYVKGANAGILANPYPVKKYGIQESLRLFREYYRQTPELQEEYERVKDKDVGCYCKIDETNNNLQCHLEVVEEEGFGEILIRR